MTQAAAHSVTPTLASPQTKPRVLPLAVMRPVRLAIQLVVLALLLAPLWWPVIFRSPSIYQGNIAASRLTLGSWSIPMSDPFTALCILAGSGSAAPTLWVGAGLILAFYLLLRGRAFCGYACPVHLVLEGWDKLLVKFHAHRDAIGAGNWPRWLNIGLAVLLLVGSAWVGLPLFEPVNPINALIRSVQHLSFAGLWLVACVVVLEAIAGRRVFCRHLCPVGGFYSAINRVGMAGVAVDPESCTGCRKCTQFCLAASELLETIEQARRAKEFAPVQSAHCTMCFECAAGCEHASIVVQNRWRRTLKEKARIPV